VKVHNVDERSRPAVADEVAAVLAGGPFESVWRDRVEPLHDAYIEGPFDRVQEAVS
jgi:hypothetical protein